MVNLESAQARVDRAGEHYKTLDTEVRRFAENPANTVVDEANPDRTQYLSRVRWGEPPDLSRFGVLLGDCVHSLRCALDHTVYALAVANEGTEPPAAHKTLLLPIKGTEQGFKDGGAWRIETLTDVQRTLIERLQPYQAPQPTDPPRLVMLDELDVVDKHRTLPVTIAVLTTAQPGWLLAPSTEERRATFLPLGIGQPLEDGAALYAVTFDKPTEVMGMDHNIDYAICVEYRPSGEVFEVFGLLEELFGVTQHAIYALTGEKLTLPDAWDGSPMGVGEPPENGHL